MSDENRAQGRTDQTVTNKMALAEGRLDDASATEGVWVDAAEGEVPLNAVAAGYTQDGTTLYVGRAFLDGHLLPANVHPQDKCAYVHLGRGVYNRTVFQVLVDTEVKWEKVIDGRVPEGAIPVGRNINGQVLYMGRTPHAGALLPGKVDPFNGWLHIPRCKTEVATDNDCNIMAISDYQILAKLDQGRR